jgi:hypothetical protein
MSASPWNRFVEQVFFSGGEFYEQDGTLKDCSTPARVIQFCC